MSIVYARDKIITAERNAERNATAAAITAAAATATGSCRQGSGSELAIDPTSDSLLLYQ
jgi:hypothetical protein